MIKTEFGKKKNTNNRYEEDFLDKMLEICAQALTATSEVETNYLLAQATQTVKERKNR